MKKTVYGLIERTTERIKELDIAIEKSMDKYHKHLLIDSRKQNYKLYISLTGKPYPHQEELVQ